MSESERFVIACLNNNAAEVRRMMAEGVDINARSSVGCPALCGAMYENHVDIVRLLLSSRQIKLDITGCYTGCFGLHEACANNSVESVRLFLAHPACTRETVMMVDREGNTAEMDATANGNFACAKLIREYLDKAGDAPNNADHPSTLPCAPSLAHDPRQAPPRAPPLAPSSLIPECPVCMDELRPPLQIFTCGNGHLICSICLPRVTTNRCLCQAMYTGRATAMEQIIRHILGIV